MFGSEPFPSRLRLITGKSLFCCVCFRLLQASLVFKAGFDAGFLYILYHIYDGYHMPRLTKCSLPPCPNTVDCFISRPTEKKIFTIFMVVTSAICIFMCICEMSYLICKRIMTCVKRKHKAERKLFTETHEMTLLARPKSEFMSKSSIRVDPTASIHTLSSIKTEEEPAKTNAA